MGWVGEYHGPFALVVIENSSTESSWHPVRIYSNAARQGERYKYPSLRQWTARATASMLRVGDDIAILASTTDRVKGIPCRISDKKKLHGALAEMPQ